MSVHTPRTVRIVPDNTYTSRNRANRFVLKGRAEWTDDTFRTIRFFPRFASSLPRLVAPWQVCYRTAEAPVLPPSIDWLKRHYPTRLDS